MGLFNEVHRLFIAVPDEKKGQILYKWPDINLRKFSTVVVNADEQALFVNQGQVIGVLGPGQHKVDANELPFLGLVIDWASDGNAYRAELYFVSTREFGDQFGGRIDDVQDPQTGMIVTLRTFGEYSLKIVDPSQLVLNWTGTQNVERNEDITDWVDSQILKTMRPAVTRSIVSGGWPILGLSSHTEEIEAAVLAAASEELASYGIRVARFGNFNINLDEKDQEALKGLARDTAYTRLAGGYQQFAAGEALRGAGEGMSQGGGAVGPMFMAAGMGMGQGMMQTPQSQAPPPPDAPGFAGGGGGYGQQAQQAAPMQAGAPCVSCGQPVPAGSKFCPACGTAVPQAPAGGFCTSCGAQLAPGARFCAGCGTPTGAQPDAAAAPPAAPSAGAAPPPPPAPPGGDQQPPPPPPPAPPAQ